MVNKLYKCDQNCPQKRGGENTAPGYKQACRLAKRSLGQEWPGHPETRRASYNSPPHPPPLRMSPGRRRDWWSETGGTMVSLNRCVDDLPPCAPHERCCFIPSGRRPRIARSTDDRRYRSDLLASPQRRILWIQAAQPTHEAGAVTTSGHMMLRIHKVVIGGVEV